MTTDHQRPVDAILSRPFDPSVIKKIDKGGRACDYVPAAHVVARLIEAWGTKWSLKVNRMEIGKDGVFAHVTVTAPEGNSWDGYGWGDIHVSRAGKRDVENAMKTAVTDALKIAVHWPGVALHLYGDGLPVPDAFDEVFGDSVEETTYVQQPQQQWQQPQQQWQQPQQQWQQAPPPQQQHPPTGSNQCPHLNDPITFGQYGPRGKMGPKPYGWVLANDYGWLHWAGAQKDKPDQKAEAILRWGAQNPQLFDRMKGQTVPRKGGPPPQQQQQEQQQWPPDADEEPF